MESSRRGFYKIYWDEYDGGQEAFDNDDDGTLLGIIFDDPEGAFDGMNVIDEICLFPSNRQIFSDGRLDELLELQKEFFQNEI